MSKRTGMNKKKENNDNDNNDKVPVMYELTQDKVK